MKKLKSSGTPLQIKLWLFKWPRMKSHRWVDETNITNCLIGLLTNYIILFLKLEENLKELENKLVKEMNDLSTKEDICMTEKRTFDEYAMINKRLEAELGRLNAERE